jgi:type VI secretion system secreted protein Hcp
VSIIAYLTLTGAKQGVIKGGVTTKGHEGTIAVTAVSHEITTPIDQATGAAAGKRKHEPITITAALDQATPKLYQAAVTNEILTAAKIAFWRPSADAGGTEVQYFTIALTNALIVEVALDTQQSDDAAPAKGVENVEYEEIKLTYQKIEWTWTDGGITATDSWAALV